MAAPVIAMPARGDRSAPQFNTKQPRELRRYFADLEYCFGRAQIVDDTEKKSHACRFVDVDTSELWESLAEFADITKTYTDILPSNLCAISRFRGGAQMVCSRHG